MPVPHRVTQSLSDISGYDAFVHRGSAVGVFEAVSDMFAALPDLPLRDAAAFRLAHKGLVRLRNERLEGDIFRAVPSGRLVTAAMELVKRISA